MSEVNYTYEQRMAMELRDRNLLVSAAAGAGKTSVMVGRITKMATDPSNPIGLDRMLVVTFTNAAAAEMKDRIRKSLSLELSRNPANKGLRKQIALLNQANISTIHSFCSEVIRSNYHLVDVDPAFSVCDEMDALLMLGQSIEEVISLKYEENPEGFHDIVNSFGRGRDDRALVEMISSLYQFLRSMPDYHEWMHEKVKEFTAFYDDFSLSPWGEVLLDYSAARISGLIAEMKAAVTLNDRIGGPDCYNITAEKDISSLSDILETIKGRKWNDCHLAFSKDIFTNLESAPRGTPDSLKGLFKDARDGVKKEYKRISSFFTGTSEEILEKHERMAPMFHMLESIVSETDEIYRKLKNKHGFLDYNDLEHLALECLRGEAGEMYRRRFIEVFIDEYQDSNPIQEAIIRLVSGRDRNENNIFMVGDLKQSIYGFRHAQPEQFKEKYDSFSRDTGSSEVSIELSDNYRSRKQIIDFTNLVLDRLMTDKSSGIDYRGNARLSMGASYNEYPDHDYAVDIRLVCTDDKSLFDAGFKDVDKEAAVAGREIIKLIGKGLLITDKSTGEPRPVRYSDITILMRSPKGRAENFVKQLSLMGIPAKASGTSDFFGTYEIIVMLSFLKIIDNPRQDIPLLAVLRSSMFGFSDRELTAIRTMSDKESFYDCLCEYGTKEVLRDKITGFREALDDFRTLSYSLTVDKLIWTIMHETGFYNNPGHSIDVDSSQANLRRLFELAGSYGNNTGAGVYGFLGYIENMADTNKEINTIRKGGNPNEVNIMSIHKSKGLEFPVVILAGTGTGFNRNDKKEPLLWNRKLGFGPDYINYDEGFKISTAAKKSLQIHGIDEETREELRILYVALTRAREKLIITGITKNPGSDARKWILTGMTENGTIDPGKVLGAGSHLDWIMSALVEQSGGASIHEMAEVESGVHPGNEDSGFDIEFVPSDEIAVVKDITAKTTGNGDDSCLISSEELIKRFEWRYPHEGERGIHRKISVTELKKSRDAEEGKSIFGYQMNKRPAFLEGESEPGAARRGTLLHNVLAAIDYELVEQNGYIEDLLARAGAAEDSIESYKAQIKGFIDSSLGIRVRNSSNAVSEKAFLYPIKATRVYPEKEGLIDPEYTIMLQGIIDCLFFEEGNIIIIDYKSDNVIPGNEEEHALMYKLQLDLYSEAAEGLTGLGVSERYIYFLKTGKYVRM